MIIISLKAFDEDEGITSDPTPRYGNFHSPKLSMFYGE
jgi:hypothetical protein